MLILGVNKLVISH